MAVDPTSHLSDETLERFAMSKLAEPALAPCEEHLLLCHLCQDKLQDMDKYVRAAKSAAAKLPAEPAPLGERIRNALSGVPRSVWGVGLAAACALLLIVPSRTPPSQAIELSANRGTEISTPQVKRGSPVTLQLDLTDVSASPIYTVEVVNASGALIWEGKVEPAANKLTAAVPEQLAAGRYWVRLYGNSLKTDLLREYPLAVK